MARPKVPTPGTGKDALGSEQALRIASWAPQDTESGLRVMPGVPGGPTAQESQAGNANWNLVPDVLKESLALNKFAMPPVRHCKEVYDCVILCVDRHRGYLVAFPALHKGLTAEAVDAR